MEEKEMFEFMKQLKTKREEEIAQYKLESTVTDVIYIGKIKWREEIDGVEQELEKDVYMLIEEKNGEQIYQYYDGDMQLLAVERENEEKERKIFPSEKYKYKEDKSYLEEIQAKDKEAGVSLNELEEKEEQEQGEENREKRKPNHVIERVNPEKAKMDYWQNLKQAFDLPDNVETIAFAYPVSSEDKVDYANITVHLLDKEGYIINDIDVGEYFLFDTATGNNPTNDKTLKYERDENKGKAQIEENNTMIRLKSAKNPQNYISLEQKDGIGDYNDIYGGRKAKGRNDNVETQFETDYIRVWDSEYEKMVKENAGEYNINKKFDEAKKHKEEHGEDGYISIKDADGNLETGECVGSIDFKVLATKWGYRDDNGKPDEEKAKEIFLKYRLEDKYSSLTTEKLIEEISDILNQQYKDTQDQ